MASAFINSSLQAVHNLLETRFGGKTIRIYEAGGGSMSFLQSSFLGNADVTVLDIDEIQLKNNCYADKKVLGDVQSYAFPANSFELIVCYNVIEHLNAPDKAIRLFFGSLAPNGLLFVGAPNPQSFSGWITRLTPHWVHVGFYRHILREKTAGQPGHVPFRTIFHPIVTPAALIDFCRELGFKVVYFKEYQGDQYSRVSQQRPLAGMMLNAAVYFANALTLWRKDLKNGNFHIVLEKPADAATARQT
jgi:2-polyprenyl-3-methyl-5-hydroxy-6-metoxy-1,4-benzoquinol methylase